MKKEESLIIEITQLPQPEGQTFAVIKMDFAFLAEEKKSDIIWL
ncbi:hypothetical protein ACR780_04590 [Sphingobacterium faecium]|nr:hypothetical protein [Sphingobacterium faecium]